MNIKYILLLSTIVLTSCTVGNNPQSAPKPDSSPNPSMTMTGPTVSSTAPVATSSGESEEKHYLIRFTKNEGFLSAPFATGSKMMVHFESVANKTLTATLSSPNDPKGNIRITQIILPDQKSDGPFGRDLKYSLTQTGQYMLIIGENKMAGDPWSGQVELKLTLK